MNTSQQIFGIRGRSTAIEEVHFDETRTPRDCSEPELMVIEACVDLDIVDAVDDGNGAVDAYLSALKDMVSEEKQRAIDDVRRVADRVIHGDGDG